MKVHILKTILLVIASLVVLFATSQIWNDMDVIIVSLLWIIYVNNKLSQDWIFNIHNTWLFITLKTLNNIRESLLDIWSSKDSKKAIDWDWAELNKQINHNKDSAVRFLITSIGLYTIYFVYALSLVWTSLYVIMK